MSTDRPKMCVHCGKLMGVGTECPYCGKDNSTVGTAVKRWMGTHVADGEGGLSVTSAIVTVNVFLYVVGIIVGGIGEGAAFDFFSPDIQVMFRLGLQSNEAIDAGQWWRLVMMIFLHLGFLHVAFNTYLLWMGGQLLEQDVGSRLMFVIYMGAGLAGSIASWFAGIGGAGASGAVFGILGAILTRRRLLDGDFAHPISQQLIFLIGLNVVFGLFMGASINHVAHGGGLVAGVALAWVVTRVPMGRGGAVGFMVASWGLAAVTLASFVLMTVSLFHGDGDDLLEAMDCWRGVEQTLVGPLEEQRAQEATACLAALPDLEPTANEARDAAQQSLAEVLASWQRGDSVGQERASKATEVHLRGFVRWVDTALPRYGLGRGPR